MITSLTCLKNKIHVYIYHYHQYIFRVAGLDNLEASIKLGLAYLYNDGLAKDQKSYRKINSQSAGKYFCKLEQNEKIKSPFIWMFIRPPWSTATQCCKSYVLDYITDEVKKGNHHPHLLYCIGKVFLLFEVMQICNDKI